MEAEESGWTDCFSWDDLLYTGRDLAIAQVNRVNHVEACNYEIFAADSRIAKEARECLIADQYGAASAPYACNIKAPRVPGQLIHDEEYHQLIGRRSKFVDGLAYNHHCTLGASSMASDASSGPPSSSHQLLKMTTQTGALLNTMRIVERPTSHHSKLGVACKRARGAFHESAVQDTYSKTRRIATQSNHLHPAVSSFSAAQHPVKSSQLQCSAAEASSHEIGAEDSAEV